MDIENAKLAGEIATKIEARQTKITAIEQALADGWRVNSLRAVGPNGEDMSLIVDTLDVATSQQALGFALQIYQGQIAALQAQLDAL